MFSPWALPATVYTSLGYLGSSFAMAAGARVSSGRPRALFMAASAAYAAVAPVSVATHVCAGREWVCDRGWKKRLLLADKLLANSTAALTVSAALAGGGAQPPNPFGPMTAALAAFWGAALFSTYWYHVAYRAVPRSPPEAWMRHHCIFHASSQVAVLALALHASML